VDILVDEQTYEPTGGPAMTVGELADEVVRSSQDSPDAPRIVVGVFCDEEPVPQDNLDHVLTQPVSDFEKLELQTQSLRSLVKATLTQAITLFEEAAQLRIRVADLLAESNAESAMEYLQRFFNIWKQVQQSTLVCAQALGVDLETMQVNGRGLVKIFEPIRDLLNELKDAMVNHDFVLVGDILRYEFEEPFDDWRALLGALREQAES